MNIFVLDKDPKVSAEMLCDKHVVKMILESAQMLCTTIHFFGGNPPYKPCHFNHPCTVWTRKSRSNYFWLLEHAEHISAEYTERYGKVHSSDKVIKYCRENAPEKLFDYGLTDFALAMPEEYKISKDPTVCYREYYLKAKGHFLKYKNGCKHNLPTFILSTKNR